MYTERLDGSGYHRAAATTFRLPRALPDRCRQLRRDDLGTAVPPRLNRDEALAEIEANARRSSTRDRQAFVAVQRGGVLRTSC